MEKKKNVSFILAESLGIKLKDYCKYNFLTISEYVRKIVLEEVEKEEKKIEI